MCTPGCCHHPSPSPALRGETGEVQTRDRLGSEPVAKGEGWGEVSAKKRERSSGSAGAQYVQPQLESQFTAESRGR